MTIILSAEMAMPLSRLLLVMAEGEVIARHCAEHQARAAEESRSRRFFRAQGQHESFHAFLFRRAAKQLSPDRRHVVGKDVPGLRRYRRYLDDAISRQRWDEVVIGQQLVLENLGELVLHKLDQEMNRRGAGFGRTRSLVLRQERAHQHFGSQWVERRLRDDRVSLALVRDHVEQYVELADRILQDVAGLLEGVGADPYEYRREIRERMPVWATGAIA